MEPNALTVLLVEDDKALCEVLRKAFRTSGLVTREAGTAGDAIRSSRRDPPDVVVLDLLLPDAHGEVVLRHLMTTMTAPPIVVLSGVTDIETKCRLLRLGARDYVTKPFEIDELVVRVHNALSFDGQKRRLFREGVALNLWNHTVSYGSSAVSLTPRACHMLALLLLRVDERISWCELASVVWGYAEDVRSNTFRVHVLKLRRAIVTLGVPLNLRTIRGFGVVLESCRSRDRSKSYEAAYD